MVSAYYSLSRRSRQPRTSSQFKRSYEYLRFLLRGRLHAPLPIYWSWYKPRNFGDWVTPFLYEAMTKSRPIYCPRHFISRSGCIMGAGSILGHLQVPDKVIVWGTGIIHRKQMFSKPKYVLAVRGPLTRKRMLDLGYYCPEVYGDPAILLPSFLDMGNYLHTKSYSFGYLPHFVDFKSTQSSDAYLLINPSQPVQVVARQIISCETIFTSSLHGLIVSHALSVPAVWILSSNRLDGDNIKFYDYLLSVNCFGGPISLGSLDYDSLSQNASKATMPCQKHLVSSLLSSCPW